MGNLANEGEEFVINFLLRNTGTRPENVYLGLATAAIDDTGTLATITEEDDTAYARQAITFGAPAQNLGKAETKNTAALEFGPWDAAASHSITYGFITDAASGTSGMIIAWFELAAAKQPSAGETLTVPIDDLVFDLD